MRAGSSFKLGSPDGKKWYIGAIALFVALGANSLALAFGANAPFDDEAFKRAGLKVQWFAQAGLGSRGELVDWTIEVDENDATTIYRISAGKVTQQFSDDSTTAAGDRIGDLSPEELDGYIKMRQEVIEAEMTYKQGKPVKSTVSKYSKPKSTLFMLTSGSVVRSVDAETGVANWSVTVDDPRAKGAGIAASNKWIVAAVGRKIHCLEAETGVPKWSHFCRSVISGSPSVVGNEIYVPLLNGMVERFRVGDDGRFSQVLVSTGVATTKPLVTGLTVGWGNSKGDFSVSQTGQRHAKLAFQLKTESSIVAAPAYHDYTFFVASRNGFLYSVDELKGGVNWEVATGASITQSPFVIGEFIYVINERDELHKFQIENGRVPQDWEVQRGVKSFLGASETRLYFLNKLGRLEVRSLENGEVVATADIGEVAKIMPQLKSDRIYVVDRLGTIRCVREFASNQPYFHNSQEASAAGAAKPKASGDDSAPADADNPFLQKTPVPDNSDDNPFKIGG